MQQLLTECRVWSEPAICQLVDAEGSRQGLQPRVVATTTEQNEWCDLEKEASEKLKIAEDDAALQLSLREAAVERMDAHTAEIAKLQEELTAKSAELSEWCAKNGKLADGQSRLKAHDTTEGTVPYNLKSVTDNCERPSNRAKVSPPCEDSSTMPSMASFSALLAEQKDCKNFYESLTLENLCTSGFDAGAKELREKLATRGKAYAASKTLPKEREKRATVADKRLAAFETERSSAEDTHLRLAELATHSEADANRARTDLRDAQARLFVVEQKAKLARKALDKVREQSARSAKAAEESSHQLTEVSTRAKSLEAEVKSIKSQMSEVVNVRDYANSSASEKGRQARMLES